MQPTKTPAEPRTEVTVAYQNDDNERYGEIIQHMSTCCLCGSELSYHHETDYVMLTVREEAHCDSCCIRTKKDSYTIQ